MQILIDNIEYILDPITRTASVCRRTDYKKYAGDIVIPATVTYDAISYRVTNIGEAAFYLCKELISVVIPDSVTSIGEAAFYLCKELISVVIPNSVTSIGDWAFCGCVKLASMTLSDNLNSIGDAAFIGCSSLTSITIPKQLMSIGRAFAGTIVTSIAIPHSVTSIEAYAFQECRNLTSIVIPSGVTDIGERAFDSCVSLESIVVEPGNPIYDSRNNCNAIIETATNTLIAGCRNTIIPDDVTSIGVGAFSNCRNLVSISIPSSVTSIGFWAFGGCDNLVSITIPDSVTTVGDDAFLMNPWLDNLPAGPIYINTVLYKYKGEMPRNTSISVRQGTLRISSRAFEGCENLISVTIPNSVTSIGHFAFQKCKNLESIVVEPGNPVYDSRNNCNAIIETATNTLIVGCKSTIIPNGVTCIGDVAFWGSEDLASITIPNTVTSIEDYAFYGCAGLTSIVIPNSVTSIGESAFSDCANLASITIPNSVMSIGVGAFEGTDLTSIVIPDSVTSIGEGVFGGCNNLTQIVVEPGNPTYDSRNHCNAIVETATNTLIAGCRNTIIPNSVTRIGYGAFIYCENLTSITILDSVISIGEGAFSSSGLTSIIIPNSVTRIGRAAFDDCKSLMSITLPASIEEIGAAVLGSLDRREEQQTIFYVPQGMTEKFCAMGLERWRNQIVEINPQDENLVKNNL